MLLVDTSVWVTHLRQGHPGLSALLEDGEVLTHPFVVGELACGRLLQRMEILDLLETLPVVVVAEHEEVLAFIEKRHLAGSGIGYVDAHLLASATLSHVPLWTEDRALREAARRLGIAHP
jgi:hypothetical protein